MLEKKHKKILFVLNSAHRTGASIYAEKIIAYLSEHKKDLHIAVLFAHDGELIESFRKLNVLLLSAGQKASPNTGLIKKLLCRIIYYVKYSLVVANLRPDFIYSNTITNNGEVVIAKLFKAKTIVHSHEGLKMAQRMGCKIKFSSVFTDKYIAVSNYAAEVITRLVNKTSVVIHNGIDVSVYPSPIVYSNQIRTVGIIGTVDRNKGQLILIKALDILVNAKKIDLVVKIVGAINDSEYEDEIRSYCSVNGLGDRVIFTGPLAGVNEIYSEIDCVVSASFDEAFPLVSLESMALGLLLISSNTGGNKELIANRVNGLLFPVGDHVALAEQLFWAWSHSQLTREISLNARFMVSEKFNLPIKLELIAKQIATF
jgi:glycosyltransferase involved in cell wall biosynthesis